MQQRVRQLSLSTSWHRQFAALARCPLAFSPYREPFLALFQPIPALPHPSVATLFHAGPRPTPVTSAGPSFPHPYIATASVPPTHFQAGPSSPPSVLTLPHHTSPPFPPHPRCQLTLRLAVSSVWTGASFPLTSSSDACRRGNMPVLVARCLPCRSTHIVRRQGLRAGGAGCESALKRTSSP